MQSGTIGSNFFRKCPNLFLFSRYFHYFRIEQPSIPWKRYSLGFSPLHFSAVFKKQFGVLPSHYNS